MAYSVTIDTDNQLVSIEEAKTFIGVDLDDQTDDEFIKQLMNSSFSVIPRSILLSIRSR